MQRQLKQQQLQMLQSVPREEVLTVVLSLQISSLHQHRGQQLRRLSILMVVHIGLS